MYKNYMMAIIAIKMLFSVLLAECDSSMELDMQGEKEV